MTKFAVCVSCALAFACTSEPIVHDGDDGAGGASATNGGATGSGGTGGADGTGAFGGTTASGGTGTSSGTSASGGNGPSNSSGGSATTTNSETSTTGGQPTVLRLQFTPVPLEGAPAGLTDFVFLPNGDEFLALSKTGHVTHYRLEGGAGDEPEASELGSFDFPGVFTETDCGAISLVLDNDFEDNGLMFLAKCTSLTASGVYRYQFDAEAYDQIAATEALIIEGEEPLSQRAWHNVGALNMDADGNLWVPFGDKTISANGQDRMDDLGALLRIVPNRELDESGYEPTPGNPFEGDETGSPNIYAYGIRSPWRAILDRRGRPWFGDVGSSEVEELNVVSEPGQNFGWANAEGVCQDDCSGLTDPVASWDRSSDHPYLIDDPQAPPVLARVAEAGIAYDPTVNDRYQGLLDDRVIFTDACVGFLRAIEYDDDHVKSDEPIGHLRTAAAFRQAGNGYIYVLTFGRCQTDQHIDLDNDGGLFRAELAPAE